VVIYRAAATAWLSARQAGIAEPHALAHRGPMNLPATGPAFSCRFQIDSSPVAADRGWQLPTPGSTGRNALLPQAEQVRNKCEQVFANWSDGRAEIAGGATCQTMRVLGDWLGQEPVIALISGQLREGESGRRLYVGADRTPRGGDVG
jgi:hypothetical protein